MLLPMTIDRSLLDLTGRLVLAFGLAGVAAVATYAVGGWALRGVVAVGLAVVPS